MNLSGKRLLICEEALIQYRGHYHAWVKSIKHINELEGIQVEVAANKEIDPDIRRELSAHPIYSVNSWEAMYSFPQAWKRYLSVFRHNLLVYKETKKLLNAIEPVDCVLLPAVRIHHLIAWRFLCGKFLRKRFKRIVIFVITSEAIYDENYTHFGFKKSSNLIKSVLRSFKKFADNGEVILAGDSHITCNEYTTLSGIPFTIFPSPGMALSKCPAEEPPLEKADSSGPVFSILGLSVYDKGIDVWQKVVLRYLKENKDGNARFVFQWAQQTIAYNGDIIAIDEKLRQSDKVEILERVLSEDEYNQYFQDSDFLVLPYRLKTYFNRTSGVLIEAACSGKPVIVTENTWLAWAMNEYGAGVTAKEKDPEDLYQKLLYAVENWKTLSQSAIERRPLALKNHSNERYLNCLWEAGINDTDKQR